MSEAIKCGDPTQSRLLTRELRAAAIELKENLVIIVERADKS